MGNALPAAARRFMIFKDERVVRITPKRRNFSLLEIGFPETAVIDMIGRPTSVSAIEGTNNKFSAQSNDEPFWENAGLVAAALLIMALSAR
jgi:hypothetical protein